MIAHKVETIRAHEAELLAQAERMRGGEAVAWMIRSRCAREVAAVLAGDMRRPGVKPDPELLHIEALSKRDPVVLPQPSEVLTSFEHEHGLMLVPTVRLWFRTPFDMRRSTLPELSLPVRSMPQLYEDARQLNSPEPWYWILAYFQSLHVDQLYQQLVTLFLSMQRYPDCDQQDERLRLFAHAEGLHAFVSVMRSKIQAVFSSGEGALATTEDLYILVHDLAHRYAEIDAAGIEAHLAFRRSELSDKVLPLKA